MEKEENATEEEKEQIQEPSVEQREQEEEEQEEETQVSVEPFRLDKYALVATVANNGLILLYEFKPVEEARKIAQRTYERM